MEQPNSELDYIDSCLKLITDKIHKQKEKIERLRREFDIEPLYEIKVLKMLYAKRYKLNYKKETILKLDK